MNKEFTPLKTPFGTGITRDHVREVWDTFIKPTQDDWAPPQSAETLTLMGILREAYRVLPPTEKEDWSEEDD